MKSNLNWILIIKIVSEKTKKFTLNHQSFNQPRKKKFSSNFHYHFPLQNRINLSCESTPSIPHHPQTQISIPQKRNDNRQWSTSPDLFKWLSFRASNSWAVLARPLLMTLKIISSKNFFSLHSPYFILFLLFHVPFC